MEKNILVEVIKFRDLHYHWEYVLKDEPLVKWYDIDGSELYDEAECRKRQGEHKAKGMIKEISIDIENRLFSIQEKDRAIFINSVLYHLFFEKEYIFEARGNRDKLAKLYIKSIFDRMPKTFQTEKIWDFFDSNIAKEDGKREAEKDRYYFENLQDFSKEIYRISTNFNLKYDERKYPLPKFIKASKEQQAPNIVPYPILLQLEAQRVIQKEPLRWLKTKSLLAYFVDVANDKLNLKSSGGRRQIQPFEMMFNMSGLGDAMSEYKNKTGQKPQGYEIIDNIFK